MYRRKIGKVFNTYLEKREAIMRDSSVIQHIPNASEELIELALDKDPYAIIHLNRLNEEPQRYIVHSDPWMIQHIHNPSQELLDYVYKNHRTVFDKYFEKVES